MDKLQAYLKSDYESPKPSTTGREWEAFKQTSIWQDIEDQFYERLNLIRDELETETQHDVIIGLQAEASVVRVMLNMPDLMMQRLEIAQTPETDEDDA